MATNPIDQITEVMAAPLGQLISAIGKGVGEAQAALDEGSLHQTLAIYQQQGSDTELTKLLREIGYQPTFYVLPETEVEAHISLSFSMVADNNPSISQGSFKNQATAIPINAGNINRFNLNGSSFAKIKFKIIPVPPPTAVTEMRIIPDLVTGHLTITAAISVLQSLGLSHNFPDGITINNAAIVQSQSPAAGSFGRQGDEVTLIPTL